MKFYINVGKLIDGLLPAYCLSIKKIEKDWYWAEKITIESSTGGITALAYQKDTFVKTNISEDTHYGLGYLSMEKGFTTVNSFDLMDALRSFAPSDSIIVCDSGNKLKLINAFDEEEFQTVSAFDSHIGDPEIASEFTNELTIDRKLFTKGIKKVAFAMGGSETQTYYKCLMFKVSASGVRFAAGSGARFVAYDIEGIQLTDAPLTIHFPQYTIPVLRSILSKANADEILIKQTKIATGSINQAVIECGGTQIVISNLDHKINDLPLNSIIEHTYPYVVSVKPSDLKPAISGSLATFTKKLRSEYEFHRTTASADFIRGFLTFQADAETSAVRKAVLTNYILSSDDSIDKSHSPCFMCNSVYFEELISKIRSDGEIILSFEDSGQADKDKKTKPVLVKFPIVENKSDKTKEEFYIFFATAKE